MADTAEYIRRRFRATSAKTDEATGVGIIEINAKGQTALIYSLYYPVRLSNKDIHDDICRVVGGLLDDGEQALINVGGIPAKYNWRRVYEPRVIIRGRTFDGRYEQTKLLADDAVRRRSTIYEELERASDDDRESLPRGK